MAILNIENTGVDHLYPDGVPIAEVVIDISSVFQRVARISALALHSNDFYKNKKSDQKEFSELHGEGDRISTDFLKDAAGDILPVFAPMQRWMNQDDTILKFEFDTTENPGKIIYRWQVMDTRIPESKDDYTSITLVDIRTDLENVVNVKKYAEDAFRDFLLKELYDLSGNDKLGIKHTRRYEQNRQYVAYHAKRDLSLQTQYNYAGV